MKLMRSVRCDGGGVKTARPGPVDASGSSAGLPALNHFGKAGRRLAVFCLTWLVCLSTAYGRPASPGLVTLAWNASADPTVVGYHLYFGGVTGNYTNETDVTTNTLATVTGLFTGATYYFTATSYNAAGIESTPAPEVSWTVLPTTPAISGGLSATGLTYGQPLSAATISGVMTNALGVVVPGTFAFGAPALVPAAGAYTASVIFTPTDAIDYTTATNTISVTVSPAPLTITAVNAGKTYGQTLTFPGTGFAAAGLVNGDKVSTVALTSAGAPNTAPVGAYAIMPGAILSGSAVPANYTITLVPGSLTVTPAPLTVTAMNQNKVYGQAMTFGGGNTLFTAGGLKNGDLIGTVTLTVSNNGGAATASVAGSPYLLTPAAATGGTFNPANYAITYITGNLTVSWTEPGVTDLPVVINLPVELNDGTFQLTFTGGNAGVNYAVQGSADLVHWTTLTNLTAATNGLPAYVDGSAVNNQQRFYRTATP